MFESVKKAYYELKNAFSDELESSEESIKRITERQVGEVYPLSIGTAMIFESDQSSPDKWHRVVLFNLRTLLRNIYQSIPTEFRDLVESDDLLDAMLEEIELLKSLVPEHNHKCVAEFYLPDYDNIFRSFKRGNPRLMQTAKQKAETVLFYKVFRRLAQRKESKRIQLEYRECGWELDRDNRNTTLVTSYPSDLLSQYKFPQMNLLESHTGKVKERKLWYTKLTNSGNDDISHIPFNKFTLTVFGDGVLFLVSNRKVKKLVLQMASRDKWSYITTESRIRGSITKVPHMEDRAILNEYF